MASKILEINNLEFSYQRNKELYKDFSFEVEEHSILCLIGPNGAGKTTLIRLVSGLLQQKKGDVKIFGKPLNENKHDILKRIFVSIEEPKFYSNLTAAENLEIICLYRQITDSKAKIETALQKVGLENDNKKFKKYSTGMKQRLNIASGLVFNPDLIMMDEPFAGLDPSGVAMLRSLIKELNSQGTSFIISSHLLREVVDIYTHYAIVNDGKLLDSGAKTSDDINYLEEKYMSLFSGASHV